MARSRAGKLISSLNGLQIKSITYGFKRTLKRIDFASDEAFQAECDRCRDVIRAIRKLAKDVEIDTSNVLLKTNLKTVERKVSNEKGQAAVAAFAATIRPLLSVRGRSGGLPSDEPSFDELKHDAEQLLR